MTDECIRFVVGTSIVNRHYFVSVILSITNINVTLYVDPIKTYVRISCLDMHGYLHTDYDT